MRAAGGVARGGRLRQEQRAVDLAVANGRQRRHAGPAGATSGRGVIGPLRFAHEQPPAVHGPGDDVQLRRVAVPIPLRRLPRPAARAHSPGDAAGARRGGRAPRSPPMRLAAMPDPDGRAPLAGSETPCAYYAREHYVPVHNNSDYRITPAKRRRRRCGRRPRVRTPHARARLDIPGQRRRWRRSRSLGRAVRRPPAACGAAP